MLLYFTCSESRTIVNVGGFTKRAVGTTDVVVISANDDGSLTDGEKKENGCLKSGNVQYMQKKKEF